MCGIFGIALKSASTLDKNLLKNLVSDLFNLSQSRGKEASGLAIKTDGFLRISKEPIPAAKFLKSEAFKTIFKELPLHAESSLCLIGHSRLVTNGTQFVEKNNQPVATNTFVGVHNGIIVNDSEILNQFPDLNRESDLDSEIFLKLIDKFYLETQSIESSIRTSSKAVEGSFSIAGFSKNSEKIFISTNTGSLYYIYDKEQGLFIFASEKIFLEKIIKNFKNKFKCALDIKHLRPKTGIEINGRELDVHIFDFTINEIIKQKFNHLIYSPAVLPNTQSSFNDGLKRCTNCILPETMPFIVFDQEGVCNYCKKYIPYTTHPKASLEKILKKYKKENGEPDCFLAFSGGRDSSYGLHILKKELGMNPLVMTYDWGMVTDLARRNQARMCGALGVEHILVSANINKKRKNIRKNLLAWLRKPDIGMIPLLMAGDKAYFYYTQRIAKMYNIGLMIFCVNPLERTDFKSGFCNIAQKSTIFHQISLMSKFNIMWYYVKNFLSERSYLNSSLIDSASSYLISYFMNHPYVELFDYFKWDESEINDVLLNQYNWETDPTTTTTWRIGDGTAAFYNYIYHHIVGFTENDTFRSNQIREGILSRDQAIKLVVQENRPRYEAIKNYLDLLELPFEEVLKAINDIPKKY
jgi:asparagine synthetase B (glutamine-hydrolysing)